MNSSSGRAFDFLLMDYLRMERPSAKSCIQRVQKLARGKGWKVPTAADCRSALRAAASRNKASFILARNGQRAAVAYARRALACSAPAGAGTESAKPSLQQGQMR